MVVSDAGSVLEDNPALKSALGSDRQEENIPSPLRCGSSTLLTTIIPSLGKPGPLERGLFELSGRNLICSPL